MNKVPCLNVFRGFFWGDFNAVGESKHRRWGTLKWTNHFDDFQNFIETEKLEDLRYRGLFYTWNMLSIRRNIDRVLVNDKWLEDFIFSDAEFTSHILPDHTPMVMSIGANIPSSSKHFKFFNYWIQLEKFLPTV